MKTLNNDGYPIPYPIGTLLECIKTSKQYQEGHFYSVEKANESYFRCISEQNRLTPSSYNWHFKVHPVIKDLHTLIKEIINESRR